MKLARWLLLTVAASLVALSLAPALLAAGGPNTGYLEVCKDTDGSGVSGTFRFVVGAQTVAVPTGACSAPLELPVGPVTVTEEAVAGVGVVSIAVSPADRELSTSLPTRSTVVNIVAGDISSQTLVTFTNRSEMGLLSICKAAGTGIILGTSFTFNVAGRSIAVPAGQCASAGSFPFGSIVTVTELLEPTTRVSEISVIPPSRMVGAPNLTDGSVSVAIGMLVTQVTFTNQTVTLGSLQICKRSDGTDVTGTFTFTVAGHRVDVPVGSCSAVLQIPEGIVTVSEVQRADAVVTGIATTPISRLVQSDLASRTALVQVVGGSLAQRTTVTFTNQLQTGQVKICKVAGAGIVLGSPFTFNVGGHVVTVPAGSCTLAGTFPISSLVAVAETLSTGMQVTAIRVAPAERVSGAVSLANGSVTVLTGPGVTEVTFTNQSVTSTTLQTTPTTVPTLASSTTLPPTIPTTTVPMSTTTTVPFVAPTTTVPMSSTTTVPFVAPTTTVPVSTTTTAPLSTTTTVSLVAPTTTIPLATTTTSPPGTTPTTSGILVNTSTTLASVASTTTIVPVASTSTTLQPATTSTTSNVVPVSTTVPPLASTSSTTVDTNVSTTTTTLPCIPPTTTPLGSNPSMTTPAPGMDSSDFCLVTSAVSTPTTIVGRLVERATVPLTTARLALTGSATSLLLLVAFAFLVVGAAILLVTPWVVDACAGHRSNEAGPQSPSGGGQRQRMPGMRRPARFPSYRRPRDVRRY